MVDKVIVIFVLVSADPMNKTMRTPNGGMEGSSTALKKLLYDYFVLNVNCDMVS